MLKEKATTSFKYEILRPPNIKRYQEETLSQPSYQPSYCSVLSVLD